MDLLLPLGRAVVVVVVVAAAAADHLLSNPEEVEVEGAGAGVRVGLLR